MQLSMSTLQFRRRRRSPGGTPVWKKGTCKNLYPPCFCDSATSWVRRFDILHFPHCSYRIGTYGTPRATSGGSLRDCSGKASPKIVANTNHRSDHPWDDQSRASNVSSGWRSSVPESITRWCAKFELAGPIIEPLSSDDNSLNRSISKDGEPHSSSLPFYQLPFRALDLVFQHWPLWWSLDLVFLANYGRDQIHPQTSRRMPDYWAADGDSRSRTSTPTLVYS